MPGPLVAGIAAAGTIGAAGIGSKAVKSASETQADATETASEAQLQAQREALEYYEKQFGITRDILEPYFNIDPDQWITQPIADINQQIADIQSQYVDGPTEFTEERPQQREGVSGEYLEHPRRYQRLPRFRERPEYQMPGDPGETDAEYAERLAAWEARRDAFVPAVPTDIPTDVQAQIDELEAQKASLLADPTQAMPTNPFYQQLALAGVLGPEAEERAVSGLMESPTAQLMQRQGEEAIDRRASATGQLGGSERLRQISRFNQDLVTQIRGNRFNELGALTGIGFSAGSALAGVGQGMATGQANIARSTGSALGNIAMQGGAVQAGLQQQQGQILGGALQDLTGLAGGYLMSPTNVGLTGGGTGTIIPGANYSLYTPPGG